MASSLLKSSGVVGFMTLLSRVLGFVRDVMLAVAFLFWAANQYWSASRRAVLWNDIAIALFVLDVLLVMVGWPRAQEDASFGEMRAETGGRLPDAGRG